MNFSCNFSQDVTNMRRIMKLQLQAIQWLVFLGILLVLVKVN